MTKEQLTVERLHEALDYNQSTGEFRWKVRPSAKSRRKIGDLAGTMRFTGTTRYLYIGLDGEEYLGARLAWFYTNGQWPEAKLQFVDGETSNLRISNLEPLRAGAKGFNHQTPEGRSGYLKAHRAKYPEHYRNQDLFRDFGITLAEYNEMLDAQGGVCAICGKPETATRNGKVKNLAVDHHHGTGQNRALLCVNCNLMIGRAFEDVSILRKAIDYLKTHNGVSAVESPSLALGADHG